jgi:hypothetical protein
MSNLTELFLQNNALGGSIPYEVVSLRKLQKLALNHNELEGSVPDIPHASLGELTLMRLHGNILTGHAPSLLSTSLNTFGYIADCGGKIDSPEIMQCEGCTVCCDSDDEKCYYQTDYNYLFQTGAVIIVTLGSVLLVVYVIRNKLLFTRHQRRIDWSISPRDLCGRCSVYYFLLAKSTGAWYVFAHCSMSDNCVFIVRAELIC